MDKIEKEIADLLDSLEEFPGEGAERTKTRAPISIEARRRQQRSARPATKGRFQDLGNRINPPALMLASAAMVVGGLVLSAVAQALLWVSFAGMLLFVLSFALSFVRRRPSTPGGAAPSKGPRRVFWRDRYIQYEPHEPTVSERVKRLFRRG